MVSILSTYKSVPKGYRKVYLRLHGLERTKLKNLKEALKNKVTFLYLIDHQEKKREIFEKAYEDLMNKVVQNLTS